MFRTTIVRIPGVFRTLFALTALALTALALKGEALKRRISLVLEAVTPSQNETLRQHWGKAAKQKQTFEWLLLEALSKQGIRKADLPGANGISPVGVRIVSYRHNTLDEGNLIGGCKSLVDAMRDLGFFVDDSPKHFRDSYGQAIDRKNKRTEIEITWLVEDKPTTAETPKPTGRLPMFTFDDHEAEVARVQINGPAKTEDDSDAVKARIAISMQLTDEDVSKLPRISEAVSALLKASRAAEDDDGPNSVFVAIKGGLPDSVYEASRGKAKIRFNGEVALRPKVSVVEGAAAIAWTVEATIPTKEVSRLASFVGIEDAVLTVRPIQGDLFAVENDEAAA